MKKYIQLFKFFFLILISTASLHAYDGNVSISPTTQNVVIGTEKTNVTINIAECPEKDQVTVTYEYDGTSDTVIFGTGNCEKSQSVEILIPGSFSENQEFDVVITSAIGKGAQEDADIVVSTATIKIVPLPSNTPTISISPVTKNIHIDTVDRPVLMNIVITECPNKEDINVTYVNEANTSDSGMVTFYKDSCTESSLSQDIFVNVPVGYGIGQTFDVNITASTSGVQDIGSVNPDTASITILETISDLNITKSASKDIVDLDVEREFYYTIVIFNSGPDDANETRVIDRLPVDINLTAIEFDSASWDCSESNVSTGLVDCSHIGAVAKDVTGVGNTIILHVLVPDETGFITNTASVSSGNDGDILNNEDSVTIEVVDRGSATDLCYVNSIALTSHCEELAVDNNSSFFYGNRCDTSVTIGNVNPSEILYDVEVTKLYDPDRGNGTCEPETGCEVEPNGYEYDLGTLNPYRQVTISDSDTYSSAADGIVSGISLHGTYVKDGLTYSGEIFACTGGAFPDNPYDGTLGNMDIVDSYTYATYTDGNASNTNGDGPGPDLTTKIAGEPRILNIVYLAEGTTPVAFTGLPFAVLLYLADCSSGTCVEVGPLIGDDGRILAAELIPANSGGSVVSAPTVYSTSFRVRNDATGLIETNIARRNLKIIMRYDDVTGEVAPATSQCILRSSQNGNLQDVASCFNDENKLEDVYVDTAAGCLDTWTADNGQVYGPCSSQAGNDGFPLLPPYDIEPACLSCLLGPEIGALSVDAFAVRPKEFRYASAQVVQSNDTSIVLDQSGTHPVTGINKLRSGEDYNLTVYAVDNANNNNVGYDQTTGNIGPMTKHYRYYGVPGTFTQDETGTPLRVIDVNLSAAGQFVDGNATAFQIRYDEVGVVDLDLNDSDWASIDYDDTPIGSYTHFDGGTRSGRVIYSSTGAPLRLTVKPYDFNITAANVWDNNNPSGFTYLSDDMNMTARIPVTILAQNKSGGTTQNYSDTTTGLYEQLATFEMAVANSAYPSILTLVPLIEPNADLPFLSGQAVVGEDDENVTKFNFDRNTSVPVNPFKTDGLDVNISVTDVDAVYGDANGSVIGDATFVYGRAHMARTRAMCNGGNCPGNMTFYYEFYGNKNAPDFNQTLITDLIGTPSPRSLDSVNWYRNTQHNTANGDGNVTGSTTNIPLSVTATYSQNGSTSSAVYDYTGSKGYPYKGTVTVPESTTAGTQSWLIYDKYKPDPATDVQGELEYYGPGKWSSDTGAAVSVDDNDTDNERNQNTNRRIRW